ncbi:beta-glucanase [Lewinellaceae bacterium SD302]|nr:beta-glucanase [Lewinellaceae bacterium SD302]
MPILSGQTTLVFDDFEGNSNVPEWIGDDCLLNPAFANPFPGEDNPSATVLRYQDIGGQYANARFQLAENFDLSTNQTFSLLVYLDASGTTGNQNSQISLKLQNGTLPEPWTTQSEIIKPIIPNEWQMVTFNFESDNFINLDPASPAPTLRDDFNRVVIQINGENNNDQVLAYLDNLELSSTVTIDDYVYDQLVWSDEFEGEGALDPTKWYHQTIIPDGNSWFNGEVQHYTDRIDNSFVDNGTLKIVAKRETYTDQGVTKQFTSARLNSKFAFTYGRVEIRAKLPFGVGTWPALWTLGKNITENGGYWQTQGFGTTGWPACGEIDIMEHWGDNQNYISSALHTPSSFGGTVNNGGRVIPGVSDNFHLYAATWTPEYIEFSVDGIVHYRYEPAVQNNDTWPFDLDQYLLFNVAVLPNISASFTESELEVDYVRIYQESPSSVQDRSSIDFEPAYPNPFSNELNLDLGTRFNGPALISIHDLSGRTLLQRQVNVIEGAAKVRQLSELGQGVYILSVEVENDRRYFKAVKN